MTLQSANFRHSVNLKIFLMHPRLFCLVILTVIHFASYSQPGGPTQPLSSATGRHHSSTPAEKLAVIGYYAGRNTAIDSFATEKLTHIIYSFCHLNGNLLYVNNANDTATIRRLVALKDKNPNLKVILSLGGWGGCKTCPDVFPTDSGRKDFVSSGREVTDYFHTNGLDLDWAYPSLEKLPGHPYTPQDKDHFTELI